MSFLKSFFILQYLHNLEKLQNTFCWLIYFCLFFSIACAWSLQRLKMLISECQFLSSCLVYDTKIEQSVAWLLQRLKMLSLELQFLSCSVVYSSKTAKIDLSVHVIITKIEDAESRTSIFDITCYLQCEVCKDWSVSSCDYYKDWKSWAQDVCKIWHSEFSMTKILYLIWN